MRYRLYFMNRITGHIDRADNLEAASDGEAMKIVRALGNTQPMELWYDTRKVLRIETPAAAIVEHWRSHRPAHGLTARNAGSS